MENQITPLDKEALKKVSANRMIQSKVWFALGWFGLIVGTLFQEYGLIFGGWLSFLIAMLYKDVANLQTSIASLLNESSKRE